MFQYHPHLDRKFYEGLLTSWGVSEEEYLKALKEVTDLFPLDRTWKYITEAGKELEQFSRFNLLPPPYERLPYNPIPILLHAVGKGIGSQLLYLGLALKDFRGKFGRTEAFRKLAIGTKRGESFSKLATYEHYRGALFEIEIGAMLVRSGLTPRYQRASPDFVVEDFPLGVESRSRDAPIARAVAQGVYVSLPITHEGHMEIDILAKGEQAVDDIVEGVLTDVESMLKESKSEWRGAHCQVRHDASKRKRTIRVAQGEYRYEATLSHLIEGELRCKEKQLRKTEMTCVVALDVRSLVSWPIDPSPQSEAEKQYGEWERSELESLRGQVIDASQRFLKESQLVKGVLLWQRRWMKTASDEVHRRNLVTLVCVDHVVEVDADNLSHELTRLAPV